MQKKSAFILASVVILAGFASLQLLVRAWEPRQWNPTVSAAHASANVLGNPPGITDRLVTIDAMGWKQGLLDEVMAGDEGIRLAGGRLRSGQRVGQWMSPVCATDFAFTELLPSWNAFVPPGTSLRVDVRTRDRILGTWSPWLYIGSWGMPADGETRVTIFNGGTVHVDVLVLDRPADAFQFRLRLSASPTAPVPPNVRRLTAAYSGIGSAASYASATSAWQPLLRPPPTPLAAHDLEVPFRTQQHAPPDLRGEICSPTSVSMVLQHFGIDRPTLENAQAIYDPDARIFGNWNRAVQFCAQLGLQGHLARFRGWEDVKAHLAAGQPLIASVRFGPGEFPSSVLSNGTAGHLLVVRGFTPDGRIIVNDPASAGRGERALYDASDFSRAWFDKGGVAYVIHP